jgi:hypothetical protein
MRNIRVRLPYFELESPVAVNQLKIGTVRGDEPGTMRSSRERDEYVEMQVSELVGRRDFAPVDAEIAVQGPDRTIRMDFRRPNQAGICK